MYLVRSVEAQGAILTVSRPLGADLSLDNNPKGTRVHGLSEFV